MILVRGLDGTRKTRIERIYTDLSPPFPQQKKVFAKIGQLIRENPLNPRHPRAIPSVI
jgi:hypothetical protein